MDPSANLRDQLALAWDILNPALMGLGSAEEQAQEAEALAQMGEELARLVLALDEWIRKGGFLPQPWRRTP